MAPKPTRHRSQWAFRHRSQIPLAAVEDGEPPLMEARQPSLLAPRQLERCDPRQPPRLIRRRQRRLTRPGMVAILVSLVWRRGPSVAAVQTSWARARWWGMAPRQVSPQASPTRRDVLPAAVMG